MVRFRQVKVVVLCASLLAMLSPALTSCGVCTVALGPPPQAVLTVDNGVVYSVDDWPFRNWAGGGKRSAMRASDGKMLWQNTADPYFDPNKLHSDVTPARTLVAPVVDGQTVIETMGIGLYMALRATDGKMLWHSQPLTGLATSAHGAFDPPPVVAGGVIYAAVGYGTIAAWDEGDGYARWASHFAPDAEVGLAYQNSYRNLGLPLPVMAGSVIYASAGRSVYALRASDGSLLWRLPDGPTGSTYSAPVVAANTVFVADSDGTVFALDAETGAIRWRSPGYSSVVVDTTVSRLVVQGQTVFVASQGSNLRALDAATGAQLWRYQTHIGDTYFSGTLAPLVITGGRVYLVSLPSGWYVLDAATGQEMWQAPLDQGIFNSTIGSRPYLSTPAVDQVAGTVVMVGANGVEAWNVTDGQMLWAAHISDEEDPALVESAVVTAGMVYVGKSGLSSCGDGGTPPRVVALRDTDGTKRWQDSI